MLRKDLLIVDDNNKVNHLMSDALEDIEFNIHCAYTVAGAQQILRKKHIDCVILDLSLPDGSGLEVCKFAKENFPNIKILVLTNKSDLENRISSFNNGADDYLPKPFYPEELLIRVKRLLKMIKIKAVVDDKKNGIINLDIYSRRVKVGDKLVRLTEVETLIMEFLLAQPDSNKDKMLRFLNTKRNIDMASTTLSVAVNRLRQKLYRITGMKVIKSKYGQGYYIST